MELGVMPLTYLGII